MQPQQQQLTNNNGHHRRTGGRRRMRRSSRQSVLLVLLLACLAVVSVLPYLYHHRKGGLNDILAVSQQQQQKTLLRTTTLGVDRKAGGSKVVGETTTTTTTTTTTARSSNSNNEGRKITAPGDAIVTDDVKIKESIHHYLHQDAPTDTVPGNDAGDDDQKQQQAQQQETKEEGWFQHPDGDSSMMMCAPLRNVSNVSLANNKPVQQGKHFPGCLRYNCTYDEELCDNSNPTNYNGPEMPCCVHILRDMARWFDRILCFMGLEYFPGYGTLLGLARSDRFIPWTVDNDFLMDEQSIVVMKQQWNDTAEQLHHGIGLVFSDIYRVCATPEFAGGQLRQWAVDDDMESYYYEVSPYSDVYQFRQIDKDHILDRSFCELRNSDVFPLQRKAFYNGTLYQQFPHNPDAVLTHIYGANWTTPDSGKNRHGNTHCKVQWAAVQEERAALKKQQQQEIKDSANK